MHVDLADPCLVALGGDLRREVHDRLRSGGIQRRAQALAVGQIAADLLDAVGRRAGPPCERGDRVAALVQAGADGAPEEPAGARDQDVHSPRAYPLEGVVEGRLRGILAP